MLLNYTGKTIKIRKKTIIAKVTSISLINLVTSCDKLKGRVKTGQNLEFKYDKKYELLLKPLLSKYRDIFANDLTEVTQTQTLTFSVDTGDHPPIKQRPFPTPMKHRPIIDKAIDEMLQAKIIEPSSSPWNFPVVLVKKPDNSFRFCVDLRKLNKKK